MKKLIITLSLLPSICFGQDTLKKTEQKKPEPKIKYQYVQVNMLKEQYDTIIYVLLKTDAEFQKAVAAINIFKNQYQIISVYDTIPKTDSVFVKPKKSKKK